LQTNLVAATQSTDHAAPASLISYPFAGAALRPGVPVTITGTASDPGSKVWSVEVSTDEGGTWRTATGTTNWSLIWTPAKPGPVTLLSRAVDDSGNLQDPAAQSLVTVFGPQSTIWNESSAPQSADAEPDNPVELGVKIISKTAGAVVGLRFHKGEMNSGPHAANLWTSNGTLLATAAFSGETLLGWQQASFPSAVTINSNTVYVVSYHCPEGHYSFSSNYFTLTGITNGPLRAPGVPETANGLYSYGPPGTFPTNSHLDGNYWVDVVFHPKSAPALLWLDVTEQTAIAGWLSTNGGQYVLEYKDSLSALSWTPLLPPITAVSSTTLATNNTSGAPQRYYRVRNVVGP
jgi:hypothetical protein